jgi:hypothetical protein
LNLFELFLQSFAKMAAGFAVKNQLHFGHWSLVISH